MERNNFLMDAIMDGPLLPRNKTFKVIDDACDKMFNYCY